MVKNKGAAPNKGAAQSSKRRPTLARREARLAYWLLVPTVVIVLSIIIVPVLTNVMLSFKDVKLIDLRRGNPFAFVDFTFASFERVFNDPEFFDTLSATLIYTIGGTVLSLLLGLVAALLVNVRFPARNIVRGLFLFI